MTFGQVADELYRLPPAEFTAARDERARRARAAGDRGLSDDIARLRRPTVSAWLVNMLARHAADQIAALVELGAALREAQQAGAADRLREGSAQRRQAVAALTREAKRLAATSGRAASGHVEREVEATLEAALADPAAATVVRSGRLTTALVYAGLGSVDTADVAVPPATRAGSPQPDPAARAAAVKQPAPAVPPAVQPARHEPATPHSQAGRAQREQQAAEQEVRDADEAAEEATADLAAASRLAAQARLHRQEALRQVADLEQRLTHAQELAAQAARAAAAAERSRDGLARSAQAAQRRLARAIAKMDQRHR
jgi:hypothetical protein